MKSELYELFAQQTRREILRPSNRYGESATLSICATRYVRHITRLCTRTKVAESRAAGVTLRMR